MLSLKKDVAKLCDDALRTGRAAFTYAMYLRVNLAYSTNEGWRLIGVVMNGQPMTAMLGGDNETRVSLAMLCSMVEEHLGQDLHFAAPQKVQMPPGQPSSWLVGSSGGPEAAGTSQVDYEACERLARFARRDGQGQVVTSGWKLRLHKPGGRWTLDVEHLERTETRESISRKYADLGGIEATLGILLKSPVHADRPSPPPFSEAEAQADFA